MVFYAFSPVFRTAIIKNKKNRIAAKRTPYSQNRVFDFFNSFLCFFPHIASEVFLQRRTDAEQAAYNEHSPSIRIYFLFLLFYFK